MRLVTGFNKALGIKVRRANNSWIVAYKSVQYIEHSVEKMKSRVLWLLGIGEKPVAHERYKKEGGQRFRYRPVSSTRYDRKYWYKNGNKWTEQPPIETLALAA